MSRELPPSETPRWFVPSSSPVEVVVLSPVDWWFSHWDHGAGRSRRCGKTNCLPCAEGDVPICRFVLLVQTDDGRRWLCEFRDRHRPVLEEWIGRPDDAVGLRLRIWRQGEGKRAPVIVQEIGYVKAVPVGIGPLVASLGLPSLPFAKSKSTPRA
jgi:hypothetical protein